jgi:hypothetical protein
VLRGLKAMTSEIIAYFRFELYLRIRKSSPSLMFMLA